MLKNKLLLAGAIAAISAMPFNAGPRIDLSPSKRGKPGRKDRRKMERQNRKKGRK